MSQNEKVFRYFLARKSTFLVVSFVGAMTSSVLERLERCMHEIGAHSDIGALVLNFSELSHIGPEAMPVLAKIQQNARGRNQLLLHSAITPDVLEGLLRHGLVRRAELATDLKEALIRVAVAESSAVGEKKANLVSE